MAVLTRDELIAKITARIGDDTSDDALSLLEDATDTLNELGKGTDGDNENWKQKYEDNDKAWRKRYKERFMNGGKVDEPDNKDEDDEDDNPPNAPKSFDDLFTAKEK